MLLLNSQNYMGCAKQICALEQNATSECSAEPVHLCSLTRTFAAHALQHGTLVDPDPSLLEWLSVHI